MTQKLDKMGIADAVELPRAVWELKLKLTGILLILFLLNSHAQYGN